MLDNYAKAETVIAGLEEADPQTLAHLAATGKLVAVLTERVAAFNLQFVRTLGNQTEQEAAYVEEQLLPMLTTFPKGRNQTPLTPEQRRQVESQLEAWDDQQPASVSPGSNPEPISA